MGFISKHYKLSPNKSHLKPIHRNLRVKAMISMDKKGFGLCPLVWKKNPPHWRVFFF